MIAALSIEDADAFKILCALASAIAGLAAAIAHLYWQILKHRDKLETTKDRVSHLENAIAGCPSDDCPLQRTQTRIGNQATLSFSLRAEPCAHRHTCNKVKS